MKTKLTLTESIKITGAGYYTIDPWKPYANGQWQAGANVTYHYNSSDSL